MTVWKWEHGVQAPGRLNAGRLADLKKRLDTFDDLPAFIGALEVAKAEAQVRLIGAAAQQAPVEDALLTVEEAAGLLKRSPSFVRLRCRRGHLKAMQDGRNWRIRRSALTAYERRRTR